MNNIKLEKSEGMAILTIDRPKALNALNSETLDEIKQVVLEIEEDDSVRVVIVTGGGEKAFVAGADISEMANLSNTEAYEFGVKGQSTFTLIENSTKPYIAAVNGFALGGGCELALACDIRYASENAKFGLPETTLGILPGFGGTQRLPKIVGLGRAKEIMTSGNMIDAETAEKWGLANKVFTKEELMNESKKLANKIAKGSRRGITAGLQAMNQATQTKLSDGLELEALLFSKAFGYQDQKEGMAAFLEKRPADFE